MKKDPQLDPETIALLQWCAEVEEQLVAGGATREEAQAHLEEHAEWYTDLFYEQYSPEQAAKEALR